MDKISKAITEKKTISTGRRIGATQRATVSIAVNDDDRAITGLWETVKKFYSHKKITAAQTARKVFLRGLLAEVEEITLKQNAVAQNEQERLQGRLFDGI